MLFNSVISWYFKKRIQQVQHSINNAIDVQNSTWLNLIHNGVRTTFGMAHGFSSIKSRDSFRKNVPIQTYESLKPYIERLMLGHQFELWPSEIKWFAKSSGTTSSKSKFIPVSFEALEECQFKGARDLMTIYCHNNAATKIFEGKSLMIGGSHEINQLNNNSYCGDLSAVMMNNLPFWVNLLSTPKPEIALMSDWEIKLEKMARSTKNDDVTSISGVPTWTMLLINRLLEITDSKNILDIWPNLELYMHGGVGFDPYRRPFEKLIPSPTMNYMETYNASEGFFGIQDTLSPTGDMLLMMDYGIYYEFMPMEEYGKVEPKTLLLEEVEVNTNYALVITTNAGLWRYLIGDTIMFTDINPFRFKITGRTKLFINAFGEELIIENAEMALTKACKSTNASIRDYTAAPIYFKDKNSGGHQWLIEFDKKPNDLKKFELELDASLKSVNSDYEAKRQGDLALKPPQIMMCDPGTFYKWMKTKGKLGGQNKVPRLSNNREIVDDILTLIKK